MLTAKEARGTGKNWYHTYFILVQCQQVQVAPRPLQVYRPKIPGVVATSFLARLLRFSLTSPYKKCFSRRVDHDWSGGAIARSMLLEIIPKIAEKRACGLFDIAPPRSIASEWSHCSGKVPSDFLRS